MTIAEVVAEVDRLLDDLTFSQIASSLNERGFRSGEGHEFCARYIARIQRCYRLRSRYDRLRAEGFLTLPEMATLLNVSMDQVKLWHRRGLLRGIAFNDKNECLYQHPRNNVPVKVQRGKLARRRLADHVVIDSTQEVQYET